MNSCTKKYKLLERFSVHNTGGYINPVTGTAFDFIDRKQKNLLVCIGDSWTYGDDIGHNNNSNSYRLANIFGKRLCMQLDADLLNLGQGGSSMFWLEHKAEELSAMIPELDYNKIFVICTLTEPGRAVNSHWDAEFDFIDFFSRSNLQDYFQYLTNKCITNVKKTLEIHPQVILRIGAAFTDHLRLADHDKCLLSKTWLQHCAEYENLEYDHICDVVSAGALAQLKTITNFLPSALYSKVLTEVVDLIDKSTPRSKLLQQLKMMQKWHPNHIGHQLWSDYIATNL